MNALTCKFCGSIVGDAMPSLPNVEPEFFGDLDYDACDECGRIVCMACAIFDFSQVGGSALRYLCPDCGEPTATMIKRIGAPMLPMDLEAKS